MKRAAYHHGDLRAALVDAAVQLIGERGTAGFSLAEVSRRVGVASSAPYRHFADREELLVAVGVRAIETLVATMTAEAAAATTPEEKLVAGARGYVRFAATHPALFATIFGTDLGRLRQPEITRAAEPLGELFDTAALELGDGDAIAAKALALGIATLAHGHAGMLALGAFGDGDEALELAIGQVGRAAAAMVRGREAMYEGPPLPDLRAAAPPLHDAR